jgi:hypothetical protein
MIMQAMMQQIIKHDSFMRNNFFTLIHKMLSLRQTRSKFKFHWKTHAAEPKNAKPFHAVHFQMMPTKKLVLPDPLANDFRYAIQLCPTKGIMSGHT